MGYKLGSAAADLRLENISKGMPASGGYTGPASLGTPTDRGPTTPGLPKKLGQVLKKKKPDSSYT